MTDEAPIPGKRLQTLAVLSILVLLGAAAGLGIFTFVYAKGFSYMSDNPDACANCHVMNSVYEGWLKGAHQHVAVCNDCHVPHDFLGKWYTKADNGFHHSFAFTFKDIPLVIKARSASAQVVQDNCIRCHSQVATHAIFGTSGNAEPLHCVSCHRMVGHSH